MLLKTETSRKKCYKKIQITKSMSNSIKIKKCNQQKYMITVVSHWNLKTVNKSVQWKTLGSNDERGEPGTLAIATSTVNLKFKNIDSL